MQVVLTAVPTDPLALFADASEAVVLALYCLGTRRLAHRSRRWPGRSAAGFVLGVAALWVAVGSGLAAHDDVDATAHVVQHVLLMMVAPPLLALGKPVTLAIKAAGRPLQLRILGIVHSRAAAVVTFPVVTWFLYMATMYGYFLTPLYRYSLGHPLVHEATHLWCVLVGCLYFWPLLGLDPARRRRSYAVRVASLLAGMPFEAFLGIAIAGMARPIAPGTTLAATRAAGEIFWILAMTVSALCLAAVLLQWSRQLEREGPREDRRVELSVAGNRARAEQLGVRSLPPGFTVPWWRLAELEAQAARPLERAMPPEATGDGRPDPRRPDPGRADEGGA